MNTEIRSVCGPKAAWRKRSDWSHLRGDQDNGGSSEIRGQLDDLTLPKRVHGGKRCCDTQSGPPVHRRTSRRFGVRVRRPDSGS
jgi:hypothetical protein